MVKTGKAPAPLANKEIISSDRQEEIKEVLSMSIDFNNFIEIKTSNYQSWKTSFYEKLRKSEDPNMKFTFQKLKNKADTFRVWRIE